MSLSLAHHDYDRDKPAGLRRLTQDLAAAGAVIVASSEGGLFEYGSDQTIMENLRILHGPARFVTGSVTGGDAIRRRMIAMSGFKVIPRGLAGFTPLAEASHFSVVKARTALTLFKNENKAQDRVSPRDSKSPSNTKSETSWPMTISPVSSLPP